MKIVNNRFLTYVCYGFTKEGLGLVAPSYPIFKGYIK
jgi:hypothetical protein